MGSQESQDFVLDITKWLKDMYEKHPGTDLRLEIIKAIESVVKAAVIVGVFESVSDCDDDSEAS